MTSENRSKLLGLLTALTNLETELVIRFIFSDEFHERWPENRKIFEKKEVVQAILNAEYPQILSTKEAGELAEIKALITSCLAREPQARQIDLLKQKVQEAQNIFFHKFMNSI